MTLLLSRRGIFKFLLGICILFTFLLITLSTQLNTYNRVIASSDSFTEIHRFFNKLTGVHFYTINIAERDQIIALTNEWSYEGSKFTVLTQDSLSGSAVYRFFNTKDGGHIYTTSEDEKYTILNSLPKYSLEGIKFRVFNDNSIDANLVGVHRFFNLKTGRHLFTSSETEKNNIVVNLGDIWKYEGIKFYVYDFSLDTVGSSNNIFNNSDKTIIDTAIKEAASNNSNSSPLIEELDSQTVALLKKYSSSLNNIDSDANTLISFTTFNSTSNQENLNTLKFQIPTILNSEIPVNLSAEIEGVKYYEGELLNNNQTINVFIGFGVNDFFGHIQIDNNIYEISKSSYPEIYNIFQVNYATLPPHDEVTDFTYETPFTFEDSEPILETSTLTHETQLQLNNTLSNSTIFKNATLTPYPMDDASVDGIDLLVEYTNKALSQQGGSVTNIVTKTQAAIFKMNNAFKFHGITSKINLVGVIKSTSFTLDNSSSNANTLINAFKSDQTIHNQRLDKSADLVMLITGNLTGVCGVGHDVHSVVSNHCMNLTIPHEIGHNLNLSHDRANAGSGSYLPYSYGYNNNSNLYTIMSYPNGCTSCTWAPYFSDPTKALNGTLLGNSNTNNALALQYSVQESASKLNKSNTINPITKTINNIPSNILLNFPVDNIIYNDSISLKWFTNKTKVIASDPNKYFPNYFLIWVFNPETRYWGSMQTFKVSDICQVKYNYQFKKSIYAEVIECEVNNIFTLPQAGDYKIYTHGLDFNGYDSPWLVNFENNRKSILYSKDLPIADFTTDKQSSYISEAIQFTDKSQKGVTTWQWDFDNNGSIDSTDQNPIYTYNSIGTYSPQLTVTNPNGTNTIIKNDLITVLPPEVNAKILTRNIDTSAFNDTTSYGKGTATFEIKTEDISKITSITSWQWDLNNDGTIDSTQSTFQKTLTEGTYKIRLVISDGTYSKEIIKNGFIVVIPGDIDYVGLFSSNGTFTLSGPQQNNSDPLIKTIKLNGFNNYGYVYPIIGDWDGDGKDSIGMFNVSTDEWFLSNTLNGGDAEITFKKGVGLTGNTQTSRPIAGDWDGDGKDSIGLYYAGIWYLSNDIYSNVWEMNISFPISTYNASAVHPLIGDWNGDGKDTIGYYKSTDTTDSLKLTNKLLTADINDSTNISLVMNNKSIYYPVSGDWDGDNKSEYGFYIQGYNFLQKYLSSKPSQYVSFSGYGIIPFAGKW
jgi:PKD repeat protein